MIVLGAALAVGSAVATAFGIKLMWPLLVRYALARPNARSSHKVPTPQGGGSSVVIVSVAAILAAAAVRAELSASLVAVVSAGVVLAAIGAVDDIVTMRALPRLVCQLVAATAVIVTVPEQLRLCSCIPLLVERGVLLIGLVWFVNLVNFMDGIDMITVVEVVPICVGVVTLAVLGCVPPVAFVCAAALGGAMLGFAPFNRPVARLFLGDVGSLPIGLWLGWLLVLVALHGHPISALLMPLYYLADATITLLRRAVKRERIWEAHRTHFYQRAMDGGYSVVQIDTRILFTNIGLVTLAVASTRIYSHLGQVACLFCGAVLVVGLLASFHRGRG